MKASGQISPNQLFSSFFVSMNARLTNQRGLLADYVHVKGNIVYFAARKYHEKISSRFVEI